ncbi:hypothetical protein HBI62_042570 [Parastagonospora nodorum]|nr:hypothetical protein HBI62_042570 [Parastagonospora nodorum]
MNSSQPLEDLSTRILLHDLRPFSPGAQLVNSSDPTAPRRWIQFQQPAYSSYRMSSCQANRCLYSFVKNYLSRYRYNKGFTRLPDNVLLIVIEHLSSDFYELTRFARTSQRFFPLAMNYLIRKSVQGNGDLLGYTAARGMKIMVRRMITIGADVNMRLDPNLFVGIRWRLG